MSEYTESTTHEPEMGLVEETLPEVVTEADAADALATTRNASVTISEKDYVENMRLAEEIGKVKASQAVSSALSLSVIRWFDAMKTSGSYKGKTLIGPDGKTFTPETFEQLCDGMGFARRTIDEHLQNLAAFGEERLNEMRTLGLTVRNTRKLRKALKDAPEEQRQAAFAELKGSAPEELQTTIDVLVAQYGKARDDLKKAAKDKEQLKDNIKALEIDIAAKNDVAKARNQQLDEAKEALARATSPLPANVELRKAQKNANARKLIDEKCNAALMAVFELAAQATATFQDADVSEDTAAYVHGRVSLAVKDMAARILDAGIDVDMSAEFGAAFGNESDGAAAGTED